MPHQVIQVGDSRSDFGVKGFANRAVRRSVKDPHIVGDNAAFAMSIQEISLLLQLACENSIVAVDMRNVLAPAASRYVEIIVRDSHILVPENRDDDSVESLRVAGEDVPRQAVR